jgi:hypothetical protein
MAAVAAELDGTPLRVVTNPAAINPPCAVVEPPVLERLTDCAAAATVRVHLLAPGGVGSGDALAILDDMLDAAAAALDPDKIEPTTYLLPATGEPAPALTLTMERTET